MIDRLHPGHLPPWLDVDPSRAPDTANWTVLTGFSPFAPWERKLLMCAYSESAGGYIGSSSASLLLEFELRMAADGIQVSNVPLKDEIQKLFCLQAARCPKQEAAIIRQADPFGFLDALLRAASKTLQIDLRKLLDKTLLDADRPLFFAKLHYNRPRCYQLIDGLAPTFLPNDRFPMHPSFPSGHSTQAHLVVNVFEEVFGAGNLPATAREMAWEIGRNREAAGLHYESDTQAGYILAGVLIDDAKKNPIFLQACVDTRKAYETQGE